MLEEYKSAATEEICPKCGAIITIEGKRVKIEKDESGKRILLGTTILINNVFTCACGTKLKYIE